MEKPKDYYQLLGVPRDASLAVIKQAFRRLARRLQPSAFRGGSAGEPADGTLAELQAAYETLTDSERRRRYDETLHGEIRLPEERVDALAWSFVRRAAAGDLRRPFSPECLAAEIVVGAAESEAGGLLGIDVPVTATCQACGGTGGALFDCDRCAGEGKTARRMPVHLHLPPGVRDGAVFQVQTGDPAVPALLLTVHVRRT